MLRRAETAPARLLDGAPATWTAMLTAIGEARQSIHLEIYAFSHRGIGDRFVAALSAAAARRVQVRVTIDGWGSLGSIDPLVDQLRSAGCQVRVHNPLSRGLLGRLHRNHRKLLLVDRRIAIIGGINIGDDFADWEDLAIELHGAACVALASRLDGVRNVPQQGPVRVHLSRFGGGLRLRRMYAKAFSAARERIRVAHGYFLPDGGLVRRLARAARRGVDVELLLPARSDVPLAELAASIHDRRLAAAGVRIAEWTTSVLHSKVAVVDGRRLLVGSFNLDPFSIANLETLVIVDDAAVASEAESWIDRHFAAARPLAPPGRWDWLRSLLGRGVTALARLVARLLGGR